MSAIPGFGADTAMRPGAAAQEAQVAAAFERGRRAERARLAQDLHDDLGARLLTLIVRTKEPALADSLRETLRDLKALTRGLSTPRTSLSAAAAEWQRDIRSRIEEAGLSLEWSFDAGRDPGLDAETWFGLTRALRELVTNAISHAHAQAVAIQGVLHAGWLTVVVEDDGCGRQPERWAAGLGVSGVRRRARELGGSVAWHERRPQGIRCTLRVPLSPNEPSAGGTGAGCRVAEELGNELAHDGQRGR
jgi:signal transduction histidine kinase